MKHFLLLILSIFFLTACTDETKVQSLKLSFSDLTLKVGEQKQLEVYIYPLSATVHNNVSWETSDQNVAVVDQKGVITAVYAGECTITAKTKGAESHCLIKVLTPKYNIKFDEAIAFNEGKKGDGNLTNYVLRLYQNTLSFDSLGHTMGNGLFLNLNIYSENNEFIPEGIYKVNSDSTAFSIIPGELKEIDKIHYATGSYLGQYSVNGLAAVFIKTGEMSLSIDDKNNISCSFTGPVEEEIKASFSGIPKYYNSDNEANSKLLVFETVKEKACDIMGENEFNHSKVSFKTFNDTVVEFIVRYPKSLPNMPVGNYHVNSSAKAFTMPSTESPDHCMIIFGNDTISIVSGNLKVNLDDEGNRIYNASFSDTYNNNYILQSNVAKSNILMYKIKNIYDFVD